MLEALVKEKTKELTKASFASSNSSSVTGSLRNRSTLAMNRSMTSCVVESLVSARRYHTP